LEQLLLAQLRKQLLERRCSLQGLKHGQRCCLFCLILQLEHKLWSAAAVICAAGGVVGGAAACAPLLGGWLVCCVVVVLPAQDLRGMIKQEGEGLIRPVMITPSKQKFEFTLSQKQNAELLGAHFKFPPGW
jgi:hypothetical protein